MLQKYISSKQNKTEIKDCALCLGNVSKGFTINNMKINRTKRVVNFFSGDFNPIYTNDIFKIHDYLMKRT